VVLGLYRQLQGVAVEAATVHETHMAPQRRGLTEDGRIVERHRILICRARVPGGGGHVPGEAHRQREQ
jgi:hypothetical protein